MMYMYIWIGEHKQVHRTLFGIYSTIFHTELFSNYRIYKTLFRLYRALSRKHRVLFSYMYVLIGEHWQLRRALFSLYVFFSPDTVKGSVGVYCQARTDNCVGLFSDQTELFLDYTCFFPDTMERSFGVYVHIVRQAQ